MLASRLEQIPSRKLIGKSMPMSFTNNTTHTLWKSFIARRNEVKGINKDLYSVQSYSNDFFAPFNPDIIFTKWAAVEAAEGSVVPDGMEQLILMGGLYVVFDYKGDGRNAAAVFQYILGSWLPQSHYVLDNSRHHFEILGEKYKQCDPDSEEEIWIPVQKST